MDRIILHADINACYANIELLHHPELRGRPLAVAGRPEERHGIVLAKDELAKKCGVKTGMVLWQARRLCPELQVLPPRMELYLRFSGYVREIYADYTNLRESFGLDESWLDLTGCTRDGAAAAREIGRRVKEEIGLTVSVGVSWNKVFAKLGSDYKKPDAVTVITRDNFQGLLWPLPVEDLLYVGRATARKLRAMGIRTIGDLARTPPELLAPRLGKSGYLLHAYANGLDSAPVRPCDQRPPIKSIGNGTTTPQDLLCDGEVHLPLLALSERVGMRLRAHSLQAQVVELAVRGPDLSWKLHQHKLSHPTDITEEIFETALSLFRELHAWPRPVRSLSIRCADLRRAENLQQLDMFGDCLRREKSRCLDRAVDDIRRRFGFSSLYRGVLSPDTTRAIRTSPPSDCMKGGGAAL